LKKNHKAPKQGDQNAIVFSIYLQIFMLKASLQSARSFFTLIIFLWVNSGMIMNMSEYYHLEV